MDASPSSPSSSSASTSRFPGNSNDAARRSGYTRLSVSMTEETETNSLDLDHTHTEGAVNSLLLNDSHAPTTTTTTLITTTTTTSSTINDVDLNLATGSGTTTMPSSDDEPRVSSVARHIHGWSWQTFPIGMGTGAVYLTLSGIHDHPAWLTTVETVFYSMSIVIFTFNISMLLLQASLYPRRTWRLINHPVEGTFIPLMVLCLATIIIGTINYAHISGQFSYILFWIYVSLSLVICFPMLMIWFGRPHDLTQFTPAYAFLIFPMMLVGVVAFNVLSVLDPADAKSMGVLLTGYFFQGLGFFMTFFYLCIYVMKIVQTGIYDGHQANSAFIVCGPPGFTTLALIHLSERARSILPHRPDLAIDGNVWYSCNVLAALMLYGLAVYFFVFDILPYWNKLHKQSQGLDEILGYWALTFPNVGWISATRGLGDVFKFDPLYKIHLIMTIIICATWCTLVVLTLIAFWRGIILKSSVEDVLKDSRWRREPVQDVESQNSRTPGTGKLAARRQVQNGIVQGSVPGETETERRNSKEARSFYFVKGSSATSSYVPG